MCHFDIPICTNYGLLLSRHPKSVLGEAPFICEIVIIKLSHTIKGEERDIRMTGMFLRATEKENDQYCSELIRLSECVAKRGCLCLVFRYLIWPSKGKEMTNCTFYFCPKITKRKQLKNSVFTRATVGNLLPSIYHS